MPFRISLIAFDDCLASGVIGALDLLHAANAIAPLLQPDAPLSCWLRAQHDDRVQDMAAHAAVSARTLMRRFKAHTGEGPLAYLQKLRLETGKALLANTNYRLTQILERIGYHDESAFRRLFKRATNLSPREYRRRFGGKPSY